MLYLLPRLKTGLPLSTSPTTLVLKYGVSSQFSCIAMKIALSWISCGEKNM